MTGPVNAVAAGTLAIALLASSTGGSSAGAPSGQAPAAPRLLAVDRDGNQLLVIDPATMRLLHRVDVGTGPHEVVGSADGRIAYVANYGTKDVVGDSVSVVDLATGREVERIRVAPFLRPHGMRLVGDRLYFTAEGARSVARLDLGTRRVDWTVGIGQAVPHMLDMSPDGRRLFTANMLADTVSVVDVDAPPHAPLRHASTEKAPEGIALSPDGATLWVGQNGTGRIALVDTKTLAVTKQLQAGHHPARIRFSADGRSVFTIDPKASELLVIDAASHEVVRRVPVEGHPLGMWPSADGASLYLTLAAAGKVARLDLKSFKVAQVVDVGRVADGIGWAGAP